MYGMAKKFKIPLKYLILIFLGIGLLIFVSPSKDEYYLKRRILLLLQENDIVVCQMRELVDFSWQEAKFTWSGILLNKLKMEFFQDGKLLRQIRLPLKNYYGAEPYVAHSPLSTTLTPNSCLIVSKADRSQVLFQSIDDKACSFLSKLLKLDKNVLTVLGTLTEFSWQTMEITFHPNQYYYKLDFLDDQEVSVVSFSLPSNVVAIVNDEVKYGNRRLYPDTVLEIHNKTPISISIKD